ncbi:hypothetical protein BBJ28_00020943 [Nothophytophthora sp. Chile5]|nr:hypothetical protein BBJ28_00020943 [Nothophytophthora sp. Chile5]
MDSPTLLFVHGASFCKEIWEPIEHRLKQSPLLQRLPEVQFTSMDLPYHGTKRDDSVVAVVDQAAADVEHPGGNWIAWSSDAVLHQVQLLRAKDGSRDLSKPIKRRPIIGIGHSMGASALWNVEAQNPGTFDALVLFEPISEDPRKRDPVAHRYMFSTTLERENRWYAVRSSLKSFASWDRECLASWLKGAIIPEQNGSEAVVLACHPTIEASIYCRDRLWLSELELARIKCLTTFHSSTRTRVFDHKYFDELGHRWPRIYKTFPPMENTSHLLVVEDPAACADAILADIQELPCFELTTARL